MKILVIRFSSLGDVILVSSLFQKIKEIYPKSRITFLTDKRFVGLFVSDPHIDRIFSYDTPRETVNYFMSYLRKVRGERFDMILDCHGIPRSFLFLMLGRAITRKKIQKYSTQRRQMVKTHRRINIPHVVMRYLSILDGGDNERFFPRIYLVKDELNDIKEIRGVKESGMKIIGIAPGASKKTKMWSLHKMRKLSKEILNNSDRYVIFFGNKKEVSVVREITDGLSGRFLDLSGKTSIRELALSLNHCDVLISTDSGSMHLAVAVGTPVVSIFGPTIPEFGFSPYDKRSVVVSKKLPCQPCSLHGSDVCVLRHHKCMELIEVSNVLNALEKVLKQPVIRTEKAKTCL
jgi:heptosyltransferase-2